MKKFYNIFLSIALVAIAVVAQAQVLTFYQPLGSSLTIDTVTNTGTAYVSTLVAMERFKESTTIQVTVTKISGTVGGTISLQGSLDGTNFKAIPTAETATALATITAADASSTYHWRLNGSPFRYYRVSWTGTGTMAASFGATLFRPQ